MLYLIGFRTIYVARQFLDSKEIISKIVSCTMYIHIRVCKLDIQLKYTNIVFVKVVKRENMGKFYLYIHAKFC